MVKDVREKIELGDENHPEMPNVLAQMVRRLFTRLKEVEDKPKKKIITPGIVTATDKQTMKINRVFGG